MKTSQSPSLPERLKLERPLVVFDIEATGLNKRTDRIVAIAIVRYEPDGSVEQFAYLLNPGTPIPKKPRKSTASPMTMSAKPRHLPKWRTC